MKSAYYVTKKVVVSNDDGESIAEHSQSPFCKRIWQLNVLPKVRIFAWHSCRNGLLTMFNLRCRGLNLSGFCPLCDKDVESLQHAFLHCNHAKNTQALWHNCSVNLLTTRANMMDLAGKFIEKGMIKELDLFFMVAWYIWGNENQVIHNDSASPPSQVWDSTRRAILNYNNLCLSPTLIQPTSRHHCSAPPLGFYKINVDGTTAEEGGSSYIGVIIRDCTSATIGALSKALPSSFPAEVTEAYALHQGIQFALEMQINQAIFESDALSIILALSSSEVGGRDGKYNSILLDP